MVCDMVAGRRNDYLDEDVPDPDEPDSPSEDLPLPASPEARSTSPASPRAAAPAPPARRSDSEAGWDDVVGTTCRADQCLCFEM